jgi:hypothetical protein
MAAICGHEERNKKRGEMRRKGGWGRKKVREKLF